MQSMCCNSVLLYFPPTRDSLVSEAHCKRCGKKYQIKRTRWERCEEFRPQNSKETVSTSYNTQSMSFAKPNEHTFEKRCVK